MVSYRTVTRVYYAAEGDDICYGYDQPAYLRRLTIPRDLTPKCVWASGYASRDERFMGPTGPNVEDDEPFAWFGPDGYYCAVEAGFDELADAARFVVEEYSPDRRWLPILRDWHYDFRRWREGDDSAFLACFADDDQWRALAARAIFGRTWRSDLKRLEKFTVCESIKEDE